MFGAAGPAELPCLQAAAAALSKIRENEPDLPCEGLRDVHKSRISPFPSRTLVFPAVPWFSLGAAVAALPWDGEDAPELSLLLLQVLHPPTPSQVLQLPGLSNLGFKAYL